MTRERWDRITNMVDRAYLTLTAASVLVFALMLLEAVV